jgi:hypothetical protein
MRSAGGMFTPDELRDRMYELMKRRNVVPVEAAVFAAGEFESVASEQSVAIHRIVVTVTSDPVRFWVSSVVTMGREAQGYGSRYIRASLCRHLSEPQFDQLVAVRVGGLVRPVPLPLHRTRGQFLGAMQMCDEWYDVSAVAAYDDELIAFYWSTSA